MSKDMDLELPFMEGVLEGIYGSGTSGRFKSVDVWFLEMISCHAPDPVADCNSLATDPYTVHGCHEDSDIVTYFTFHPACCSWHKLSPLPEDMCSGEFELALEKDEQVELEMAMPFDQDMPEGAEDVAMAPVMGAGAAGAAGASAPAGKPIFTFL